MAGTGPDAHRHARGATASSRTASRKLLDMIGPAVLLSHSAGGPAGFLAAEARPDKIAALVQIEVLGPPFLEQSG